MALQEPPPVVPHQAQVRTLEAHHRDTHRVRPQVCRVDLPQVHMDPHDLTGKVGVLSLPTAQHSAARDWTVVLPAPCFPQLNIVRYSSIWSLMDVHITFAVNLRN